MAIGTIGRYTPPHHSLAAGRVIPRLHLLRGKHLATPPGEPTPCVATKTRKDGMFTSSYSPLILIHADLVLVASLDYTVVPPASLQVRRDILTESPDVLQEPQRPPIRISKTIR